MHTPFDNPVPESYHDKLAHYARDLAWGVEQELWTVKVYSRNMGDNSCIYPEIFNFSHYPKNLLNVNNEHRERLKPLQMQFLEKWFDDNLPPSTRDFEYWGYVHPTGAALGGGIYAYTLDHSAFDLLRQPYRSPIVFISYSHANSSALALAIEARLKYLGNHDVFVDKSIPGGRKWEEVIKKNVIACDYFVLLVHEAVFDSKYIKQEFELAVAEGKTIYPFCHHGVDPNNFSEFSDIQSITCDGLPSAKTFENAINDLLFWMGYPTY